MATSHRSNVDVVVRLVRADESSVAHTVPVIDGDDEPVLVSANVENDAVVADDTRVRINPLDVGRRSPICFPYVVVPSPQRRLRIGVFCPELAQSSGSSPKAAPRRDTSP
jgi:hypothetical protein